MSAPAGSGDHLVLRASLHGHNGWVTSIATTMQQPDMLLTASRGQNNNTQHTQRTLLDRTKPSGTTRDIRRGNMAPGARRSSVTATDTASAPAPLPRLFFLSSLCALSSDESDLFLFSEASH